MKDTLGDRIKENYENRTRIKLPCRTYTIIRIDGKAFHSYTKGLERPFDEDLINDMDNTAKYLCKNIMGAKFAYVQSDEISILVTDFETITTQSWFDNNLQKMCSVSASMTTSEFNRLRMKRFNDFSLKQAEFDSRVFQIPQRTEVMNYFIWRQQDCVRNSIQNVAQTLYSQKELMSKNVNQQQELIFQKGINWNDYSPYKKRGRIILKETYENEQNVQRSRWIVDSPPTFTQEKEYLNQLIPINN